MINKIKKLAASPIMGSDQDIENFSRIMELPQESTTILHKSKAIIKRYYITATVDDDGESIIDEALYLIFGEEEKEQNSRSQEQLKSDSNPKKEKKTLHLSQKAKDIIKKSRDENMSYFQLVAEIVDDYAQKSISIDDVNLLTSDMKLSPLDIKAIYAYFYKNNKDIFTTIVAGKTLNEEGLSYLQKALLIVNQYEAGKISGEDADALGIEMGLDTSDMKSLYDMLYSITYITPTLDEIKEISKKFERDDLYVGSNIPPKKRANFKRACNHTVEGTVAVLIDSTIFGSAENALAISEHGIYWNDDFCDEGDGYISWAEFFENPIKREEELTYMLGEQHIIDLSSSDCKSNTLFKFFKTLQELKRIEEDTTESPAKTTQESREPDLDLKEVFARPYESFEILISQAFLYASPTNNIIRHFVQYNINSVGDDDYDIAREHIMKLSDKNLLEEMIVSSEKILIATFQESTASTRGDIVSIVGSDIGDIFGLNEQIINSLQQELTSYRSVVAPKMAELHATSQQLKHYWSESEEGTGKIMTDALRGASLGMIGASLFGPLGIAAAVGASYLSDKEKEKKQDSLYQTLYDNWATAHDRFYFTELKEYNNRYEALITNISNQYVENLKKAYKLAIEADKKSEFINYFKSELKDLVREQSFIDMRAELAEHKAMFE